ncbi:redoxin domain-containing protein [Candidatus Pelagisphaera phototrophica]|nr:redoxin domain-containing protein [Candidatus Pelagisphaera phototrophica]
MQVLAILALFIANTNFLNANTAEGVRPLLIGAKIPSVDVTNQQSEPISLLNVLLGRSSVVIFYRGSWCPYCNTQLSELASIEDDLKKAGIR